MLQGIQFGPNRPNQSNQSNQFGDSCRWSAYMHFITFHYSSFWWVQYGSIVFQNLCVPFRCSLHPGIPGGWSARRVAASKTSWSRCCWAEASPLANCPRERWRTGCGIDCIWYLGEALVRCSKNFQDIPRWSKSQSQPFRENLWKPPEIAMVKSVQATRWSKKCWKLWETMRKMCLWVTGRFTSPR